jgi:hypothetical protein
LEWLLVNARSSKHDFAISCQCMDEGRPCMMWTSHIDTSSNAYTIVMYIYGWNNHLFVG